MDSFGGCDLIRAISGWIEMRCLKQLPAGEVCGISIAKRDGCQALLEETMRSAFVFGAMKCVSSR